MSRKQRKERRIQKACLKACISIHYGAYALLSLLLQMALVFNHYVCVRECERLRIASASVEHVSMCLHLLLCL